MTNTIMSFNEIKKYPLFYISDMIQNPSDSFLMYQYGPYLLMNTDYFKIIINDEINSLYYKNPCLAFMIEISEIIKCIHSIDTIGNIKENILNILTRCQTVQSQDSEIYLQKKKEIVFDIVNKIQEHQYDTKSLESALLNYSPIVPYSGTITQSEIQAPELIELTHDTLDILIKNYLKDNIIEIMLHNEDFISVDNHDSEYMLKENESVTSDLSYDIINSYNNQENMNPSVKTYFSLVYLRYAIPKEKFQDAIQTLIKINTTYNKISKGEVVNVKEAVETFSKLSLPPTSSL